MRFGAMNFPVAPILKEIEAIGQMGFDFLELAMDPPQAHFSRIRQQKEEIIRAIEHHKMGLVCHMPTFVYTAHLSDAIRQASLGDVIASLETAADLGAEKVVIHPGTIDGLAVHVPDYAMSLVLEGLAALNRRAEALDMALCIENMFSGLGPFVEPEDFDPIFKSFPQMNLVLDIGHANINDPTGQRAVDFILRFGHRLGHLHMSDNLGHMDEHLPLGAGGIEFESVVRALQRVKYDGTVTLEIFGEDRSALVRSRQMLESIW